MTPEQLAALERVMGVQPQGLSPQQQAALARASQPPQGGSSVNQSGLAEFRDKMGAMGIGATDGASFGFADNILGSMGAISAGLQGQDPSAAYNSNIAAARRDSAQAREQEPLAYGAGQIGAGAATSISAFPSTAGGNALMSGAKMLGYGGLEGALFGAGNADGVDVASQAGKGGLVGASLGLAAPAVGVGLRAAGRLAADPIAGAYGAATNTASPARAARPLGRAMQRANMTADDLTQATRQAAIDGQGMFTVADALGQPGQRAMSGVARTPGAARTELADFLDGRQQGQSERVSQFLTDSMGTRSTSKQTRGALTDARSAQANTNYADARAGAGPVDVRGALSVIDARIGGMEGSGVAGDGIDGTLSRFRSRLAAQPGPDGVMRELSDFDRVLGVKQDLQDEIGKAVRAGENNKARELGALMTELDGALEASSKGYRQANDSFRDASRTIDAVGAGEDAYRPRNRQADVVPQYQALPGKQPGQAPGTDLVPFGTVTQDLGDQRAAFRAGYSDPLLAKIENAAPGVNVARDLQSPKRTAELGAMAGNPEQLGRQVDRENVMFETRRQALGGSQSADNIADQADVAGTGGVLANLLAGRLGQAGMQVMQKGANVATGQNEATQLLLARALMSRDPQAALAPLLREVSKDASAARNMEGILRQLGLVGEDRLTQ